MFWDAMRLGSVRAWFRGNAPGCGVDTTSMLVGVERGSSGKVAALLAWLVLGPVVGALAQPGAGAGRVQGVGPATPVGAAEALQGGLTPADAFLLVEDWLRAGEVPADVGQGNEFSGVSVWIRLNGRIAARSSLLLPPGERQTDLLALVVRNALDQVAAGVDPKRYPGLERKEWMAALLGGATVTAEFAGPLVPFRAETYDDVDLGISPGVWGLAASVGEGFDAVFPLQMVANGMTPGSALRSTIAKASGDPGLPLPGSATGTPGAIAKSHGAKYYRFKTTQVTRVSPSEPVAILQRGGMVFPGTGLTAGELRAFADGMAAHLASRLVIEDGGVVELADPRGLDRTQRAAGLVALMALSKYLGVSGGEDGIAPASGALEERLEQAEATLMEGLRAELAPNAEVTTGPMEAALLASWLARRAGVYTAAEPHTAEVGEFLASRVRLVYDAKEDFFDAKLPEPARGLVALAFVRLSEWGGSQVSREEASRCVRKAFAMTTPETLAMQMPWLGWAELELAGEGELAGAVPSAVGLGAMRDGLYAQMLDAFEAGEDDADLAGGLMGATGGSVLPTWHTARPASFLATMLADVRLTPPDERVRELARLLLMLRFLRQLAVDEVSVMLYPSGGEAAKGGVRSAVWDLRQPGDATSFSLLAVSETLGALEEMERAAGEAGRAEKKGP